MPFLCEVWSLLLQQHFCLSLSVSSQLPWWNKVALGPGPKIRHSMTNILGLSLWSFPQLFASSLSPLSSVIVLLFDTPAGFCGELDVALIVVKCRLSVRAVATLSRGWWMARGLAGSKKMPPKKTKKTMRVTGHSLALRSASLNKHKAISKLSHRGFNTLDKEKGMRARLEGEKVESRLSNCSIWKKCEI